MARAPVTARYWRRRPALPPARATRCNTVSATEAGKKTINAEARFVLCQEQACKPVKETLALALDITPAAAPKDIKKPKRK